MTGKRINMKDIAKEAGVSVATVSYVINKRSDQTIPPQTVKKVNAAIKKLGYVPNLGARALASRHTRMLGLVIPQTEKEDRMMFSNTFYGEFLSAMEYETRKKGYSILISGTDVDQSYVDIARQRSLDGIVVVGLQPDANVSLLTADRIPTVFVDSYVEDGPFSAIRSDDFGGGYMAATYLFGKGHRRVAIATGYIHDNGVNSERCNGFIKAMSELEIPFDEKMICSGTVSYDYGSQLGKYFAENREAMPTAVFATADIIAVGLIKGLKRYGIRVPEDISVIGFDDGFLAMSSDPELTTIRQDVERKARVAAELVIDHAEKNGEKEVERIVLPVSLVERSSVRSITT